MNKGYGGIGTAFANPLALFSFLSLIPIVILYLIKPKPRDIKIPSLMFILDAERKEHRYETMLRKIIRDPLMLMQLLFLILLTLAMAAPFYTANETVRADHTVIVIDASASMQAENPSRFDRAKDAAEKFVSGRTSIIMAKNIPVVVLQRGGRSGAKDTLSRLAPGATTASIGDAILLATNMIEDEKGAIVVISDFSNIDSDSIASSKMLANADGIDVTYKQVGTDAENIGITYGKLERTGDSYEYICNIKSYMGDKRTVPIEIFRNGKKTLTDSVTVPAYSSELFALTDVAPGATIISLKEKDSLEVDNRAYLAIPAVEKRKILVVSETKNPPAKIALNSLPDTKCTIAKPPVLPSFGDYDLVVIGNITKTSLLPGTFNDLASFVQSGGSLVILASSDLGDIETEGLLPVQISGKAGAAALEISMPTEFTKDIAFEDVSAITHLISEPVDGAIVTVITDDNSPMLAYQKHGSGTIFYSGFGEGDSTWNDFHTRVDYPIFWRQIVDWMSGVRGIEEYNVRTGRMMSLGGIQEVTIPSGTVETDNLLFDEVGRYRVRDDAIAANLYDPLESDLSIHPMSEEARTLTPDLVKAEVEKELWTYLIILVMFVAGFELYYLRARGEL
ncbi:MAG: VWA domain-containing protein [Euryarchaeota archaeon]|nr:VWA domain-containing protein [Euryarchaeota archaeon]